MTSPNHSESCTTFEFEKIHCDSANSGHGPGEVGDGAGESLVVFNEQQLRSPTLGTSFIEDVAFMKIWVSRPAGNPGHLFYLLFKILNYLTDV